jgi:PAS domain-containing protein
MNRKTRVIRFHRTGGPEVLQIDEIELPPLKNNEVLLKMDALAISRADILFTYWNRGAQELYGWTAEEAIGKRAHELLQSVFPAPIDAIRKLGIFWATINQPPPGSIKTY